MVTTTVERLKNERNLNMVTAGGENAGSLVLLAYDVIEKPAFIEVLRSGW